MTDDEDAAELQQMVDDFQPGLYRHYKGPDYLALCLAREDETDEVVVVYLRLYPRAGLPVSTRRLRIWNQDVEHEGRMVPRFTYRGHVSDDPDEDAADDSDSGNAAPRSLVRWMKDNL